MNNQTGLEITTIVLADDHPIVRQGVRQMIETADDLKVVGEAGDGAAALRLIEQLAPAVAILDVDMPVMNGFAVAREMRARRIKTEIIFLTMHGEAEVLQSALDLDAKGYVLKDSAVTDIVASIRAVVAKRPYFSASLSAQLLNRRRAAEQFAQENIGLTQLTVTERRILKFVADEKTSKEIAEQLFISYRTVEKHRANIARKLDLQGSLALVKFAVAHKSEL